MTVSLIQTALELGLFGALTVLALYLSYTMLNVCDLSTDGCFTMGATVGAVVAISGHPFLSIPAAMAAGMASGFTRLKDALGETVISDSYRLLIALAAVVLVVAFLSFFLKTRLGLAIRATGDNPDMVRSSSINPAFTTIVGLCIANAFTALSGCLMAQSQKSVNIDIGSGMVTIALASLLIGRVIVRKGGITKGAVGAVLGAIIFRLVYTVALRFNMPAYMLKLVSSVIVIIAISGPYFRGRIPLYMKRMGRRKDNA